MNFSRSNFNIMPVRHAVSSHGVYRRLLRLALIGFAVLPLIGSPGWADEEDWPDPVYFPQSQSLPDPPKASPKQAESPKGNEKKSWWPFHWGKDKKRPLSEAEIVKVGPYDPPALPDPLLRLAFPIAARDATGQDTVVANGIYLVRQLQAHDNTRTLSLSQRGKTLLKFTVHAVAAIDENRQVTGTASPITQTQPEKPAPVEVEAQLSPDQGSLVIVLKSNGQRFESPPFPVATDTRRRLSF